MDDHHRARQRALRAARAVTLGITMLGAGAGAGCSTSHAPPEGDSGMVDDGGTADAGVDAGPCTSGFPVTEACCESWGGFWTEGGGCAVPGPFVPPAARG